MYSNELYENVSDRKRRKDRIDLDKTIIVAQLFISSVKAKLEA